MLRPLNLHGLGLGVTEIGYGTLEHLQYRIRGIEYQCCPLHQGLRRVLKRFNLFIDRRDYFVLRFVVLIITIFRRWYRLRINKFYPTLSYSVFHPKSSYTPSETGRSSTKRHPDSPSGISIDTISTPVDSSVT